MLILQNIAYAHPNKEVLFEHLNLCVNRYEKTALIGNNGVGKSTLLQLIAGRLQPSQGIINTSSPPYYIPQLFGQYNDCSVAQALHIEGKLVALKAILKGEVTAQNMTMLDDDWGIEERCMEALSHWQLAGIDLSQQMATLSGGQKTKVFLAGIMIHRPNLVLLDEPSNHLDARSRAILYEYIRSTTDTLVVVSHDRKLINLLDTVCELSSSGIARYGGNYDFYSSQKAIETHAFQDLLNSKEKALRKAREVARDAIERQQKLDARGRKKQEQAGIPTIALNTLRNRAEHSTSRMKEVHAGKTAAISDEVDQLRKALPDKDKIKIGFDEAAIRRGKILVDAKGVNFAYHSTFLWKDALSFQVASGARIALKGNNGCGKTTLINLMLGRMQPTTGSIHRAAVNALYLDQEYSLIDDALTVYEQAELYNTGALQEQDVKRKLAHFLIYKNDWDKRCGALSGGEKMRLMLCCVTIGHRPPDIIFLDEPTNNLDMQNIDILTAAINDYKGTVIAISHDADFLEGIDVREAMLLA